MEFVKSLVDLFLHLDKHLNEIIQGYGVWTYLILFLIVFCETGLVVTPFLPGDSLLFAAGTFAALGSLNVTVLFTALCVAAIVGDTVNYWIGHYFGPKVFHRENVRFLNKKHLERTHEFYEKYGGKTIIIARFIPIIRTFAPFVAGIGSMTYWRFITYNIVGGVLWVALCVFGGYFFGNLEIVKRNFSLVVLAIILISVLPIVVEFARHRFGSGKTAGPDQAPKDLKGEQARANRVAD
ncbi:MAG TPA: DedA family protein [Blastocatellia bacterium]|jgi:membrane-associated protein